MKQKTYFFSLGFMLLFCSAVAWKGGSFRKEQQKAPKVAQAYKEKWPLLKRKMHDMGVDTTAFRIFIRGFKSEKKLELWVRSATEKKLRLFQTYDICASSGTLGPKRMQGDGQVPEGFYQVSVFNPYSNYYISLGLNYPNKSDRIVGGKGDLGGAIMIHGNCVTIGCVPLTDEIIKEVYVMAVEARNCGQQDIPVHFFPAKLTDANLEALNKQYAANPVMLAFWKNLQAGYSYFEKGQTLPNVSVSATGMYLFN